jgi:streptogramin lyase
MRLSAAIYLALVPLFAQAATGATTVTHTISEAALRARIGATPSLPFHGVQLVARPPVKGWESGMVSWVAVDANGLIYEIQRGDKADPVLVLDREGTVLRSWGKGDYEIPHSIRIDPTGNVWTVDAGSSVVRKYSPTGKKLLTIVVGGQPPAPGPFSGTTDVAFAPNGHLYITDGYGNARILEYTANGKKIRQWGRPGTGPGEFKLPHSIQIDPDGTLYVADRENGRIQEFDLSGRFLREIPALGRIYSLKLAGDVLWAGMQPFEQPPGAAGWIVKLDRKTGKMLGHIDVTEPRGLHSVEQMPSGEPLTNLQDHVLWMKAN